MTELKNKKWMVYLIHHAHTDIGYTEIQEDVYENHIFDDNAPPGAKISRFVDEWNKHYSDKIEIKMAPLREIFAHLRKSADALPVAKGDWTDWWGDGVGTSPSEVKMYKDAERKKYDLQTS